MFVILVDRIFQVQPTLNAKDVRLERVNCPLQRQELLAHVKPGGHPGADPGPRTSCSDSREAGLGYANATAPWQC